MTIENAGRKKDIIKEVKELYKKLIDNQSLGEECSGDNCYKPDLEKSKNSITKIFELMKRHDTNNNEPDCGECRKIIELLDEYGGSVTNEAGEEEVSPAQSLTPSEENQLYEGEDISHLNNNPEQKDAFSESSDSLTPSEIENIDFSEQLSQIDPADSQGRTSGLRKIAKAAENYVAITKDQNKTDEEKEEARKNINKIMESYTNFESKLDEVVKSEISDDDSLHIFRDLTQGTLNRVDNAQLTESNDDPVSVSEASVTPSNVGTIDHREDAESVNTDTSSDPTPPPSTEAGSDTTNTSGDPTPPPSTEAGSDATNTSGDPTPPPSTEAGSDTSEVKSDIVSSEINENTPENKETVAENKETVAEINENTAENKETDNQKDDIDVTNETYLSCRKAIYTDPDTGEKKEYWFNDKDETTYDKKTEVCIQGRKKRKKKIESTMEEKIENGNQNIINYYEKMQKLIDEKKNNPKTNKPFTTQEINDNEENIEKYKKKKKRRDISTIDERTLSEKRSDAHQLPSPPIPEAVDPGKDNGEDCKEDLECGSNYCDPATKKCDKRPIVEEEADEKKEEVIERNPTEVETEKSEEQEVMEKMRKGLEEKDAQEEVQKRRDEQKREEERKKRDALKAKEDEEKLLEKNYLDGVKIRYNGDIKEINETPIANKLLNPQLINFGSANAFLKQIEFKTTKNVDQNQWINCDNKKVEVEVDGIVENKSCREILIKYLHDEFELTAFMLRILNKSIINLSNNPNEFVFEITNREHLLNGKWENDKKYIKILEVEKGKKKKTIMGFGPSASGKTYWTRKIINMFNKSDKDFPNVFMCVDGGIIRENSEIYQDIVKNTPSHIKGFANLTEGKNKLAPTSKAKKSILKYLKELKKQSNKSPVSVYVPETLSKCKWTSKIPGVKCEDFYKDYINLTDSENDWIGLYIWQTKENCEKLGQKRQYKEGKKYTSKYYDVSEKHGKKHMMKATGARINIHNSGKVDEPTKIKEFNINKKYILDKLNENDWKEINSTAPPTYITDGEEIQSNELIPINPNKKVRMVNNSVRPPMTTANNPPKKPPPRKSGELFQQKINDSVNEAHSNIDEHTRMQEDVAREMEQKKKEFEEKKKKIEENERRRKALAEERTAETLEGINQDREKKKKEQLKKRKKKKRNMQDQQLLTHRGGKKKRKTKKRSKKLEGRRKQTRKLFFSNFF
jgi:hypothetical protein